MASVARTCAAEAGRKLVAYKESAATALSRALAQRDEATGRLEECWREFRRVPASYAEQSAQQEAGLESGSAGGSVDCEVCGAAWVVGEATTLSTRGPSEARPLRSARRARFCAQCTRAQCLVARSLPLSTSTLT